MSAKETWIGYKALALLRPGPFRRYIIGSAISDTGTWMQVMAQGWVVSALTNKAIVLGMVNFAAGLPMLALTMIGGSVADRFDKRKILIATQIVQIALATILGWLIMTGRIQPGASATRSIWYIIIFAACLGVSIAFEMPAISALVPELVQRDEIAAAVAMDRSVFHGSRLVGPALAGLFVGWWGAAAAFFANAFSFIALIAALISLPKRPVGTKEEEEERRSGIMEGFRYVRSDRVILSMIALIALNTIFVFPAISVMLPLYVRNVLQLGPREMGWLMATSGTGAFLGALGLLSVAREKRLKFMTGNVLALWTRQYNRAGACPGATARSRFRRFRPELFWFDAHRWPDHPRLFRFGRHADRPCGLVGDLWNSRLCSSEHGRTSRMRSPGLARGRARTHVGGVTAPQGQ